jgi:hypothetical protein
MILFTFKGARFTTSTNVDNPEYYFQTNKVKFIPGKKGNYRFNKFSYCRCSHTDSTTLYFPLSKEIIYPVILPSYNDSNTRGFHCKMEDTILL